MNTKEEDWLRPRALYEGVAESLRARIFAHEFAPGSALDEAELARSYGVSRTPVREALKVLGREGLVAIEPRRGCCVAELSAADVSALLDVIEMLGLHAVREAARSGVKPAEPTDHAKLLECGRNRYLTEAVLRLNDKLQLACGPRFGRADTELLASLLPTLAAALSAHQVAHAEQIWTEYTKARRRLAASHVAPFRNGSPAPA